MPASVLNLLMGNQILGGVISSCIFAALSSIYIVSARRMRNADLRALIPSSDSNVVVVCPGAAGTEGSQGGLMTAEEAMALAEVLQCAGALNKVPSVLSCAERTRHSGVISLGGINNSFTAASLSEFCRGLNIQIPLAPDGDTLISHGSTQIAPPTEHTSVAFIIFLSSFVTGCKDPVLLIFGQYGIDTCAAARYLRTNAKLLHCEFKGCAFAIKLATHPILGYQGFPGSHEDISADVFNKVEPPRRKRILEWTSDHPLSRHTHIGRYQSDGPEIPTAPAPPLRSEERTGAKQTRHATASHESQIT